MEVVLESHFTQNYFDTRVARFSFFATRLIRYSKDKSQLLPTHKGPFQIWTSNRCPCSTGFVRHRARNLYGALSLRRALHPGNFSESNKKLGRCLARGAWQMRLQVALLFRNERLDWPHRASQSLRIGFVCKVHYLPQILHTNIIFSQKIYRYRPDELHLMNPKPKTCLVIDHLARISLHNAPVFL